MISLSTPMPRVSRWIQIFLVTGFSCICLNAFSQRLTIDSLQEVLRGNVSDSLRMRYYSNIAFDFTYINLDSASYYAEKAIKVASKGSDHAGNMKALYTYGVVEFTKGNSEASLEYLHKSLSIADKIKSKQATHIYNIMGQIYQNESDYDKAIEYYYKATELSEEIENFSNWATAMVNIGTIHYDLKDIDNCKRIYEEIISREDKLLPEHLSMVLANYSHLLDDPDEKVKYLNKSIKISKEHGIMNSEANGYMLLGDHFIQDVETQEKALVEYLKAIDINKRIGVKTEICKSLTQYGKALFQMDQMDEALSIMRNADLLADSIEYYSQKVTIHETLANIYEQQSNYKAAVKSIRIYNSIRDSVYESSVSEKVLEANAKYESEKKEAEIARQQLELTQQASSRKLLIIGALSGISVLSLLFFGFYQRNKRKTQESELALKIEKERTEDLQKLAQLKTDFFNNVSHELRTPLTMIIAPLEDLSTKVKNVNDKKDVNLALSNSKRLLNITNELMDLSKIEDDKLQIELSETIIESFFKRVFHSFDSLAQSRSITLLSFNLEQKTKAKLDQSKLEKVIINLVSNAIKYSPDHSTISLNLSVEKLKEGLLNFSILDTGHGIPLEDQPYIFDRFYQSKSTSHSSGTGIGLSLVSELVKLMGGWIKLKSEPENGSTFNVQIPVEVLADGDNPVEAVEKDEERVFSNSNFVPIVINGQKPKLLIVEDDLQMSEYIKGLLDTHYLCDAAFNGRQAIELLKKSNYDLITSDIMMPEMGGFELRETVNQHIQWKQIPFIFLTARSQEQDVLKGFRLGIDDYITKPFSSAEYLARVNNLLKNKVERTAIKAESNGEEKEDLNFVKRAENIVLNHLDDSSFAVIRLASELNYSDRQLRRKLQSLTGMSPVAFILEVRLQSAYEMIRSKKYTTVNEVMYEVGIESASYFNSKFRERFGVSPGKLALNQ